MKILSLFDGISCARVALERSKHIVERYFASEVDKYAIQISSKNFPDVIQIGDVKMVAHKDAPIHYKLDDIDLLIGGSPCQDLSIAKKDRKGLDGSRSSLFWEYVRIRDEVKPKYFILENVASMPKEAKEVISQALGVDPVMINASLVSAQNRRRYFWCGQIRERLYYNDVLCYTCLYNENRGIQTKTQRKRDAEVLDETQERHSDVQGMSERISQNKSQGNNQDLLFKMSGNQQKEQRQKQGQTKESGLSENVSTEEQKETDRVSEEISSISNRKAENGGSRQTTAQVNYKEDTGILSSSAYRDKEKINEGGSDVNFRNGTKMCCVRCNQKLNNRPFNTFIQRGNERFEQFTSDVSKLQFKETQQNNGRIYDIYQVEIPQPEDKGILLKDILEENVDEKYYVKGVDVSKQGKIIGRELEKSHSLMARDYKGFGNQSMTGVQRIGSLNSGGQGLEFLGGIGNKDWAGDGKKYSRNFPQGNRVYGSNGKSTTLSANGGGRGAKTGLYAVEDKSYCVPSTYYKENVKSLIQRKKKGLMVNENTTIRKLTPIECERLQGLPDNYTEGVSNTQRYKALGNAFNVDVVAHILSFIPKC